MLDRVIRLYDRVVDSNGNIVGDKVTRISLIEACEEITYNVKGVHEDYGDIYTGELNLVNIMKLVEYIR